MNRAALVSVAALLSLALSACGSGADSRASADTTGDEDMAHIKIGLTYLEQQTLSNREPLACKVAFEVTNDGNERVKFVLANFALVNSSGEIVADDAVGINNLMPGKSQSVWTTPSSVPCAEVAGIKNVSARNAEFTAAETTKLPIEL